MISGIFILLGFYYFYLARKSSTITSSARTKKIGMFLTKLTVIVPLIALAVFVILFMTILSGRLIERSSHALILLVLWLILTNCYAWILTYSGDKNFLIQTIAAAVCSLICIVLVTPLGRYDLLVYDYIGNFSFVIGFSGLLLFYLSHYFRRPAHL